ncbi:Uncharacterised protein [Citrobacter portucalensis]|nr:Uncharacterised protein [Citrobacter portucalensis]
MAKRGPHGVSTEYAAIAFNIIYIMRTNIDKGGICCFMDILVLLNNDASKPFQAQLPQQR